MHYNRCDGIDNHLELLDQRLLPEHIVYLNLETANDVWEAIRHLKVRGAPAIGIAAAYGLYLGVRGFEPHINIIQ